ncbi:DsbC family protein [Thermosulfurimonas sp. F29]|uniref:DsbC family protein n=1 Tax=Thermosulfurimonas sp. F29 TaxID=2867247 RepID=UPI001C834720|nr:DsbC family protein [Thermosulfurimonas sp. F29]MBX6424101.1 DsbC family protein [Thermosulfurimonas sp. F29]
MRSVMTVIAFLIGLAVAISGGLACPSVRDLNELFFDRRSGVTAVEVRSLGRHLCEVAVRTPGGKGVLYTDASGRYLLIGQVLDRRGRNLTAERMAELNAKPVPATLVRELRRVAVASFGSGKQEVFFIADPDCPFCHQASAALARLFRETPEVARDITVRVVLFPLPIHRGAREKAERLACMKRWPSLDLEKTLGSDVFRSTEICATGRILVGKSLALVKKLGVAGVPSFVYQRNGRWLLSTGALPPDYLLGSNR